MSVRIGVTESFRRRLTFLDSGFLSEFQLWNCSVFTISCKRRGSLFLCGHKADFVSNRDTSMVRGPFGRAALSKPAGFSDESGLSRLSPVYDRVRRFRVESKAHRRGNACVPSQGANPVLPATPRATRIISEYSEK